MYTDHTYILEAYADKQLLFVEGILYVVFYRPGLVVINIAVMDIAKGLQTCYCLRAVYTQEEKVTLLYLRTNQ